MNEDEVKPAASGGVAAVHAALWGADEAACALISLWESRVASHISRLCGRVHTLYDDGERRTTRVLFFDGGVFLSAIVATPMERVGGGREAGALPSDDPFWPVDAADQARLDAALAGVDRQALACAIAYWRWGPRSGGPWLRIQSAMRRVEKRPWW